MAPTDPGFIPDDPLRALRREPSLTLPQAARLGGAGDFAATGAERPVESDALAERSRQKTKRALIAAGVMSLIAVALGALMAWQFIEDRRAAEPPPPDPVAEAQRLLAEIEQLLQVMDLAPGPIDGAMDAQTEAAIRTFEELAGLPVTGLPSPELLEEMRAVAGAL